jgi:hypothetical protein
MATTASALGASRSIHSLVVMGWPVVADRFPARPVAFLLDLLVGNRAFHHQHEGIQLALLAWYQYFMKSSPFHRRARDCAGALWAGRECAQQNILDAGLRGGGDGNGIAVTAQPAVIQRMCRRQEIFFEYSDRTEPLALSCEILLSTSR